MFSPNIGGAHVRLLPYHICVMLHSILSGSELVLRHNIVFEVLEVALTVRVAQTRRRVCPVVCPVLPRLGHLP